MTTIKPNLLASVDTIVKVLGVFAFFALPAVLAAILSGSPLLVGALFLNAQAISLIPAIGGAFLPAIRLLFTTYTLSDEGIQTRMDLLGQQTVRVRWEKVTSVEHHCTIVDRILGLERITVSAYGERGTTLHLIGLRQAGWIRDLASEKMAKSPNFSSLLADE